MSGGGVGNVLQGVGKLMPQRLDVIVQREKNSTLISTHSLRLVNTFLLALSVILIMNRDNISLVMYLRETELRCKQNHVKG